jgi:RES domain-containing protein
MMLTAWRIVKEKYVGTAFDGEGAMRFGGRWNSRGVRVVYASGSISLAALETLVHLNPPTPFKYAVISVSFDKSLVEKLPRTALPGDWTAEPPSLSTQRLGDAWAKEGRSAVLELPSVLVPAEPNYLLNPAHADFRKMVFGKAETFVFDPRLL